MTHNIPQTQTSHTHFFSLKALQHDQFNAFAAGPDSPIADTALRELQMDFENAWHEKIVWAADNLFDCGKSLAESHPAMLAKGNLARAHFEIRLKNSDRPHQFWIIPPHGIQFEFPGDAPLVFRYLEKCRIWRPRHLGHLVCLLLVAIAGALAPCADCDDDDDLDCDEVQASKVAR